MKTRDPLDSEELMALATLAIEKEDAEAALGYLKRAVVIDPADVMALYVLGTVHASLGLYDRAVDEILQVLKAEPEFHVARLQLGLICLAQGDGEATLKHWVHFTELPRDNTFYMFRQGIEHFFNDRIDQCIEDLAKSIELNTEYESVREDMQNTLKEIREKRGSALMID